MNILCTSKAKTSSTSQEKLEFAAGVGKGRDLWMGVWPGGGRGGWGSRGGAVGSGLGPAQRGAGRRGLTRNPGESEPPPRALGVGWVWGGRINNLKVGTAARAGTSPAVSVLRQPRPALPPTHLLTRGCGDRTGRVTGWGPWVAPTELAHPLLFAENFRRPKEAEPKITLSPTSTPPPPPPCHCPLFRATAQAQLPDFLPGSAQAGESGARRLENASGAPG